MPDSHHERQSRRRLLPLVMKYSTSEFIGCGGWDGEIENQGHDGAILIDGCPLAKHLWNKKVNIPDSFVAHFTKQHEHEKISQKTSGTS